MMCKGSIAPDCLDLIRLRWALFTHFCSKITRKGFQSEAEKIRRLNANMIERRRMQNINVGFSSLKKILPPSEKKQTKAAILQQAVQHILRLQRAIVQVKTENGLLRQSLLDKNPRVTADCEASDCPCVAQGKVFKEVGSNPQKFAQVKYRKLVPYPSGAGSFIANRWSPVVPSENQVSSRASPVSSARNVSHAAPRGRSQLGLKVRERAGHVTSDPKAKRARRITESRGFVTTEPSNSLQCIIDAIGIVESTENRKRAWEKHLLKNNKSCVPSMHGVCNSTVHCTQCLS